MRFLLPLTLILTSCTFFPTKVVLEPSYDKVVPVSNEERKPAAEELAWWAANEKNMQNAVCREKLPVTTAEIENYYRRLPLGPGFEGGTQEIYGIELIDERPRLVWALMKLLSPAQGNSKEAAINFQDKFRINPSCTKALCAAQKIFGKDVGPQMLFLMERFDVNTSPYSFVNADTFNASEIADVVRTFELVREEQVPFGMNKQLIKFKRGYTRASYRQGDGEVLANASIELFDGWSRQSSLMRQYTLYHEFAHNYSDNQLNDYDRSATWLALGNWKEGKDGEYLVEKKKAMQGHPFVSRYGEGNPFEDFAESVSAYRFNPSLLKQHSIDKYNLIKLYVFDGLEFTSEAQCRKKTLNVSYQEQINKNDGLTSADRERVKNVCRRTFYQTILGHTPVSFFNSCVNYEATVLWSQNNAGKDIAPQSLFDRKLHISTLEFKKLTADLAAALSPEAADWILGNMKLHEYEFKKNMDLKQYCEVWTRLSIHVYPVGNSISSEYRNKAILNYDYSPKETAARGLCLDLAQGFVTRDKAQTMSRGITRENLIKYIRDRHRIP